MKKIRMKNIKADTYLVTPKDAKKLLSKAIKQQRTISKGNIDYLLREVLEDRWKLNGETIILANDGSPLDGYTRLNAIIKSGKALSTVVVSGIDPNAFLTIDTGNSRNNADMLKISGESKEKLLASTCRMLYNFEKGTPRNARGCGKISPVLIKQVLEKNSEIKNSINVVDKKVFKKICSPTIAATMHYMFTISDTELADEFFAKLETGLEIKEYEPVGLLRQKLLDDKSGSKKQDDTTKMAWFILAWNATKKRKNLRKLVWQRRMGFPDIL